MKLIIAGSRDFEIHWTGIAAAIQLSDLLSEKVTEVVSGVAKGVDTAAIDFANEDWRQDYPTCSYEPIPVKLFPADWEAHGKAAGPIRNKQMAEYADALLLIWDGESRGSANMKKEMLKLNKPVYEIILRKS